MNVKERQMTAKEEEIVLQALAKKVARPHLQFLEVGSWCGDSTIVLGKIAKQYDGNIFCIDWWKGNIDTDLETIAARKDIFSVFWKRIQDEGLEDTVIPIRTRSDIIAPFLKSRSFDLVFLDGDHRYKGALSDIELYAELVRKPGGILCGHDCDGRISDFEEDFLWKGKDDDVYGGAHCGVVLAVGNSFKDYSIDYNIWSAAASENKQGWEPTNLALAIPRGYRGFKILMRKNKFYAIHQSLGVIEPLETEEKDLREYEKAGKIIIGNSLEETKQLVEESLYDVPELVEDKECPPNFNIVRYKRKYYAVDKGLLDIDLTRISNDELKRYEDNATCIACDTLEEARHVIPELIVEGYLGFNLIRYKDKYYAMFQELGKVDVRRGGDWLKECIEKGTAAIAGSLDEIKELAIQLYCRHMQNIVDYYSTENHELNSEIFIRDKKIHKLNREVVVNITKVNDLEKELDEIKSRWWFKVFRNFKGRLRQKLSPIFRKPK